MSRGKRTKSGAVGLVSWGGEADACEMVNFSGKGKEKYSAEEIKTEKV